MDIGKVVKYTIISVSTAVLSYIIYNIIKGALAYSPIGPHYSPSPAPNTNIKSIKLSYPSKSIIGKVCINVDVCSDNVCNKANKFAYVITKDGTQYMTGEGNNGKLCFPANKPGLYVVKIKIGDLSSNAHIYVFNPDKVKLEVLCAGKYSTSCNIVGTSIVKFKVSLLADNKEYLPTEQYTVRVTRPDNSTKVFINTGNTFAINLTKKGTYKVSVNYAGYKSNEVTISYAGGISPPNPIPINPIQIQGVINE